MVLGIRINERAFRRGVVLLVALTLCSLSGQAQQATDRADDAAKEQRHERLRGAFEIVIKKRRAELEALESRVAAKREQVDEELKDASIEARLEVTKAEAAHSAAKLQREMAEIALMEYEEGLAKQELQTIRGAIALGESELKRAKDRFEMSKRPLDSVRVMQAEFALEQQNTQLKVLDFFLIPKQVKELQSEVEKAKSFELASLMAVQSQKLKEEKLKASLAQYKVQAPEDFVVSLLDDAIALEGQVVARLEPLQTKDDTVDQSVAASKARAKELKEARDEIQKLTNAAKNRISEALAMAKQVKALRSDLRDDEVGLKDVRRRLDDLERLSRDAPSAAKDH